HGDCRATVSCGLATAAEIPKRPSSVAAQYAEAALSPARNPARWGIADFGGGPIPSSADVAHCITDSSRSETARVKAMAASLAPVPKRQIASAAAQRIFASGD